MSEPLNDPRLEAAAEIDASGWTDCTDSDLEASRNWALVHDDEALRVLNAALRVTGADELAAALGWFLEDPRFQVAVGGNPNAVDRMLADARAALAKYKELKQ